jgi:hypothetical protein
MKELEIAQMEQIEGGGEVLLCYGAALIGIVGIIGVSLGSFGAGATIAIYTMSLGVTAMCKD